MNLIEQLHQEFLVYLANTFSVSQEQTASIQFSINCDEQKRTFGDISTNAALILAKAHKQNPVSLAQTIQNNFKNSSVERIEIAGPGFLNFFLGQETMTALAKNLFTQERNFFKNDLLSPQTVNIEFVSANPTGPLHLGHGRGGIIGDVLGNIMEFVGHKVTKEFYINDAGAQIKKLGASFKARCLQALDLPAELPEDGYQGLYLQDLAQQCVAEYKNQLLDKSDEFFAYYAKDHLLKKIQETLKEYGISFDVWFSEKTLHTHGAIGHALKIVDTNGYIFEKENALWFASTQFGDDKDRVVRKENGEYTYIAPDIAYIQNKLERGFTKLIYILGQDHHSYVKRLKGVMQALGHNQEDLDVILYQLVTIKESGELVRMSKRAGNIVMLEDVIQTVGKDVSRFFYLNRKADAHLDFDIDLALKQTEENPVYYIQYAYVRTNSILHKAFQETMFQEVSADDIQSLNDDERILIKKIISLKELLQSISNNYQTHVLTYYVFELAHAFHHYYAGNRVINSENIVQSRSRLAIVMILKNTFELCLELLGVNAPEHM